MKPVSTRAMRGEHYALGKRLRRARRLYLWLVYRSVFDGTVNTNKNVKLHWRVLCFYAVRAKEYGLYSPKTELNSVAFSFMSHFHRFDKHRNIFNDGWHNWWSANVVGVRVGNGGEKYWRQKYENWLKENGVSA